MEQTGEVPLMRLPISGWTIRVGRGAADRAALEVYDGCRWRTSASPPPSRCRCCAALTVTRGAVSPGRWRGVSCPPGSPRSPREFTGGIRTRGVRHIPAVVIEGGYWVAEAAGNFAGVTVQAGHVRVSERLRRPRPLTAGSAAAGGEILDGTCDLGR